MSSVGPFGRFFLPAKQNDMVWWYGTADWESDKLTCEAGLIATRCNKLVEN